MTNEKVKISNFLNVIIVFQVVGMLLTLMIARKVVDLEGIVMSAGTFTFPFYYFFSDVVTEVYGFRTARIVMWSIVIGQILFVFVMNGMLDLPSPPFWHLGGAYYNVFHGLIRQATCATLALYVSSYINIYLVSKWKILTSGRYFWLRSIGSSTIGELIFNIILFFGTFYNVYPLSKIIMMIVVAYVFKTIITIVLSYPASRLAVFLKKHDGVDVYDRNVNYTPFRFIYMGIKKLAK